MNQDAASAGPRSDRTAEGGLIFAFLLDGTGGGRALDWTEAKAWAPDPARPGDTLWLHMDRTAPGLGDWLEQGLGLSEATAEALLSHETRPRAFRDREGLVTILRGINFNPGDEPEDMIALQIWGEANRVVTLRRRRLQTPHDVLAALEAGDGPLKAGDLVADLIERLVAKISVAIIDMNNRLDALEADADEGQADKMLAEISDVRRNALALKRYMSPQHEALTDIGRLSPAWMSEADLQTVRDTIDRLRKYMEDLDVSKESAIVLQDDLNSRAASRMNRTMYMLSIVTAVFLPLGFVTGLLGVNVGGMPGVDSHVAFWVMVGLLAGLFGVQLYVFHRLRWL